MAKKQIDTIGVILDATSIFSPTIGFLGKGIKAYKDYIDNQRELEEAEEESITNQIKYWDEFATELAQYRVSDRTSIMFLPDDAIDVIWKDKQLVDSPIKYIPTSKGVPDGITIAGPIVAGTLYLVDPRDDSQYYNSKDINIVLLKDHLLEMKSVFERLGALQIDISFDRTEEESEDLEGNLNVDAKVSAAGHSGGGKYSSTKKQGSHRSKFNQLEIHKKCTGKCAKIDWGSCYWTREDETFKNEIESVIDGLTKEVHFCEHAQSYARLTSMNMHKIEAEYSYLSEVGIEGLCEWDDSAMSELTQCTKWDVHVVFNEDAEYIDKDESDENDEEQRNFSMIVEGVFAITGRGTVAAGRIATGYVYTNDTVYIINGKKYKNAVVTGVEMFRKILDCGEAGDNVGLLLKGVEKKDIKIGDLICSNDFEGSPIDLSDIGINYLENDELDGDCSDDLSEEEQEYVEMYLECLADDEGEISARTRRLLDKLAMKSGISPDRVAQLEASASQPQLTADEQEYYNTVKEMLEDDGAITPRERRLLDRIREQSGISEERAKELEATIINMFK